MASQTGRPYAITSSVCIKFRWGDLRLVGLLLPLLRLIFRLLPPPLLLALAPFPWSGMKTLIVDFPLCGEVTCRVQILVVSGVPVKQHKCLQSLDLYVHVIHCQWRCDPCSITFPSEASLRNHLAGHKRADLRDAAPKLSFPTPSIRKQKRRKRGANMTSAINEPSNVSDPAAVLAQPVLQEDVQMCPDESTAINIDDPATCQRLYTRNRRRAVREIVGNVGERCKIPLDNLAQHFSDCWSGGASDPSFFESISSEGRVDVLEPELTPTEVWSILKKAENTAPGPDRLTYHHLRSVDPGAQVLTKIFNVCIRF
ncbi:c2H2-type domain-containing protein [Caerostris darwini]|uniref:C2H2-type domain-containing protein n=1 Tax=Caerostris darwini TaxID=1538125 RepID=A0AAV4TT34_9ARAC|nr:c2H2-type domain-containing protein [Caerostris darwini]